MQARLGSFRLTGHKAHSLQSMFCTGRRGFDAIQTTDFPPATLSPFFPASSHHTFEDQRLQLGDQGMPSGYLALAGRPVAIATVL